MCTIRISICHDNNSVVITILNFKVSTNTSTNSMNNRINFFILKISSKRAFSVLITFPRRGKIAWNLRSRPNFAEPPAESPSTRYNSFYQYFYFAQELTYLITMYLYVYFSFRACIFSSFTSSLACLLSFNCFLTNDLDNWPFSSK